MFKFLLKKLSLRYGFVWQYFIRVRKVKQHLIFFANGDNFVLHVQHVQNSISRPTAVNEGKKSLIFVQIENSKSFQEENAKTFCHATGNAE